MNEGNLLVEVEDGQIVQLHIRSNLDYFYESMFTTALHQAQEMPDDIEKGIQAIIFGWFWFETTCNMWLMYLLAARLGKIGKAVWRTVKRAHTLDKLKVIEDIANDPLQREYGAIYEKLNAVRILRNRLVHFKDSFQEVQIDNSVTLDTPEKVLEFFEDIPEPELMQEFRSPKLDEHADAIRRGVEWIESVVGLRKDIVA